MKKKPFLIETDKVYQETMILIFDLMDKGEEKLTLAEVEHLRIITSRIEKYEDEVLQLKPVKTYITSQSAV